MYVHVLNLINDDTQGRCLKISESIYTMYLSCARLPSAVLSS